MTARRQSAALTAAVTALALAGCVAATTPASAAAAPTDAPQAKPSALRWAPCGDAANVTCTTFRVPRDYDRPNGPTFALHVAKSPATDPAHRVGVLFVNFGGPGASAADSFEAIGADLFPGLNERFDIIAMDPRGVGQSVPAIDCKVNQETDGIYSQPFTTPSNLDVFGLVSKDRRYAARCVALNRDVLSAVSTENVAHDMDQLRKALGERQITYVGFSYGTFLGATYASLFPKSYRAMVLDGPVDADAYINDPMRNLSAQSGAFERALGRFMQACARDQGACSGFGGGDPWDAYDALLERLDATPVRVADGRWMDGDDTRAATLLLLYSKATWPYLGAALAALDAGDAGLMRPATDAFYGRNPDGSYAPGADAYFTIGAIEQSYPRDTGTYLRAGRASWNEHEHFWFNNGYAELSYGLYPVRPNAVFAGPFKVASSSPTPLVVATTYDPATPYRGALSLVRDLGNARLLTQRGDGHTAYGGGTACIDRAVEAYVDSLALPPPGTSCRQALGFGATASKTATAASAAPVPVLHARPPAPAR